MTPIQELEFALQSSLDDAVDARSDAFGLPALTFEGSPDDALRPENLRGIVAELIDAYDRASEEHGHLTPPVVHVDEREGQIIVTASGRLDRFFR